MQLRRILVLVAALAAAGMAGAHEYQLKDLHIGHPYARATVARQPAGAAYLSIENKGKAADRLVAVSSPAATSVEIHTMSMTDNMMKMREVGEIELKPAEKVDMKPGDGYHLMLLGLRQPLKAGDKFPLTLTFEKAGKVEVTVNVQDAVTKDAKEDEGAHRH